MDRIEAMRVYTRVYERRSFKLASLDLNIPASTVTEVIKAMEKRLGVVLLERTTRRVSPTIDGETFYHRCISIINDVEEAEHGFSTSTPQGLLRVDTHGTIARHFLLPQIHTFTEKYPDIKLFISESDALRDIVREGIDCVLRVGRLADEHLVAKPLCQLEEVTVASPSYLKKAGLPCCIDDLHTHKMIGFYASDQSAPMPLEFCEDNGTIRELSIPRSISVNSAESLVALALQGMGIVQVPRYHIEAHLKEGRLVTLLTHVPPSPSPLTLLYPQNRKYSARVNVFIEWLESII